MTSEQPLLPEDSAAHEGPAAVPDVPAAPGDPAPSDGSVPADSAATPVATVSAVAGHPAVEPVTEPVTEPAPAGDPFPRDRFVGLLGRLPRYLRLAWGLAGEPQLSRKGRAGVLAAAAYLASPIDAIPGVIPVVGQVDDLAVVLLALRTALRTLDPATRERQLLAAGLAPDDLDQDLGTLGVIAAWLARRGVAIGRRLGRLAFAASIAAGRAGADAIRRGAPAVARTTTDVVRRGAPAAAGAGGLAARAGAGAARAGAGAALAGAGAVAAAAGRGLGGLRVRIRRRGSGARSADDATGDADRDVGAGI